MKIAEVGAGEVDIVSAGDVRGQLVEAGDFREEIAFQNDINALIAAVEATGGASVPWQALSVPVNAGERRPSILALLRRRAA